MPVLFRPQSVIDQMRPRIPKDVYQTPALLADAVIIWIRTHYAFSFPRKWKVLDPGAGRGVWGKAIRSQFADAQITGLDIRRLKKPAEYNVWFPSYDFCGDKDELKQEYDLIIGNPPFVQAEQFIWKGFEKLGRYGIMAYLLPADFLHTEVRGRGLFKTHPPEAVLSLVQRPNFTGPKGESLGTANTDNYVVGIWRHNSGPSPFVFLHWLDWK